MRTGVLVGIACVAFALAACGDGGNDMPASCDVSHPCPAGFMCVISGGTGICVRSTSDGGTVDSRQIDAGPPPETAIVTHPDNITTNTMGTFTFTSTPSGATFECSLDGAAFAACTTPDMLTGLGNGTHTFQVRGILNGGIDPTPASFTWRVDTAPPVVTGLVCPESSIAVSEVAIPFASDAGTTFACTLDGTTAACTSPAHYSRLSQAAHVFTVVATDTAGNHSTPATCNFTVTSVSPETTIDCPTTPVNTSTLSVSFSAVPAGATFECAIGSGEFAACTSPRALTGLGDGTTTFLVRATAASILEPTAAECDIVVDTHAPTVTIVSGPANGDTTGTTVRFTYTSSEAGSAFTCTLDGVNKACDASGVTFEDLIPGPSTRHFEVVARDAALNASAPATRDFVVGAGPTVIITLKPTKGPEDGAVVGPSGSILFTTLGGETGITYSACALDGNAVTPCSSPVPWANLADGTTHEFDVTATSTATNQSTMARRSFTVDAAGPVVTIVAPPGGQILGTDVFVAFTATDPSTPVTTTCVLDGSPTPCSAGTPFELILPGGSRVFTITAEDAFGNKTVTTRQLEIDGTGPAVMVTAQPTVSCPSSSDGNLDDAFRFTSNDQGPVTFTCQLDGLSISDCTVPPRTGIMRWSDLSDGNHTVIITGYDVFGNPGPANLDLQGNVVSVGVHITWVVDREPPTVTITTPPSTQSMETGVNGTVVFTAADNPASGHAVVILGCSIDGTRPCDDNGDPPSGNTYSRFGWHNLADGAHTVTITAQDACGPVNVVPGGVSNTWTVDAVGDTIAFTPFSSTNTSPTAGPTGVTTSRTGHVNWTLHDPRSNASQNTMAEPMPTPVTCAITPNILQGACTCTTTNPPGLAGEDWSCFAAYAQAAGTDTDATITLVYNDGAVPPNVSSPATLSWHIDATAPTVVFDTSPGANGCTGAGGLVVSNAAGDVTFTSSDSLVPSSTPTPGTISCSVKDITTNGQPTTVTCAAVPQTTFQYKYSFSGLSDGHHYQLTAIATDLVTNQTVATRDWIVDGSTPVVTFVAPSAGPGFANVISEPDINGGGTTTASGTMTITDAFGATSAGTTTACTIDSAAVACTTTNYVTATTLTEGTHAVAVTATDCVGHSAVGNLTFYVDKTPPLVTITPSDGAVNSSEIVTISARDGGAAGTMTNIESVSCTLDGATCPAASVATPLPTVAGQPIYGATLNLSELSAGRHVVAVTAVDHYGHSSTKTGEFLTDLVDVNARVFGHVVIVGQDYTSLGIVNGTSAVGDILGNGVLASGASSFTRPLNVLVANLGSQDGSERDNVETAICERIAQVRGRVCDCAALQTTCVTFVEATFNPATLMDDATSLADAILGQDAVVFTDVNAAGNGTLVGMATGPAFPNLITDNADLGTVFIATSGRTAGAASPTAAIFAGNVVGLGTLADAPPWSALDTCRGNDPLEIAASSDFPAPSNAAAFVTTDPNANELWFTSTNDAVTILDKWYPVGNGASCD